MFLSFSSRVIRSSLSSSSSSSLLSFSSSSLSPSLSSSSLLSFSSSSLSPSLSSSSLLTPPPSSLLSFSSPPPSRPIFSPKFSSSLSHSPTQQEEKEKEKEREKERKKREEEEEEWSFSRYALLTVVFAPISLLVYRSMRDSALQQQQTKWIATKEEETIRCKLYKALPLRFLSLFWGKLNSFLVPEWGRSSLYRSYGWLFSCKMNEVEKDLKEYKNLGEFFTRRLKRGVRPIARDELVSPVDGRVLTFGPVTSETVEQIKGVTYSMSSFLGQDVDQLLQNLSEEKTLQHIVIYLAPGDYHGFHSPAKWTIHERTHFPGFMLSVSKMAVKRVPGLFAINERVVLRGEWAHGTFMYVPVAATNVGNISLDFDPQLTTNVPWQSPSSAPESLKYQEEKAEKGGAMGYFRLGSTIVMVFEAPKDFQFSCEEGEKLQLGQSLGKFPS